MDDPLDNPTFRPAFLDPERAESIGYVGADDTPTFDHELNGLSELEGNLPPRGKGPSLGYEERWREIARLHAHRYTNNQIARHLGYSAAGISLALQRPFVQAEVARWRERMFSQEASDIVRDGAKDAALYLCDTVRNPDAKSSERQAAATFIVEKATGKAKQEISVENNSLSDFNRLLRDMFARGESLEKMTREVRELPAATKEDTEANRWDNWIDTNL